MMKNSKEQLVKFLKGYSYHIYAKQLRSDDPANHSCHKSFKNRMQKTNSYLNCNHDSFYVYPKASNKNQKSSEGIDGPSMYVIRFSGKEDLDIDEISVFVSPMDISVILFREIIGAKEPKSYIISFMGENFSYQPQLDSIERDLNRKIRDALVWSDFEAGFNNKIIQDVVLYYDTLSDDAGLILGITTSKVSDASELPDLPKMNKVLDGLETIVRDGLG